MNPIDIISASAGSGKTYRLSEALKDAVMSREVRPEAVLATTFTRKAAAELQERVRRHLLKAGRLSEAQRLTAARMGTVNSVCGQLVSEFAFELGLSPDLAVLDETASTQAMRRSLSSVLTAESESKLAGLSYRFNGWDWQNEVKQVVDLARTNHLEPGSLIDCAERSRRRFAELLGVTTESARQLNDDLRDAIREFLNQSAADTTKKTEKVARIAGLSLRRLSDGSTPPWRDWVKLAKADVAVASRDAAAAMQSAAALHDSHPQLHEDAAAAIDLVFGLAARALENYQQHKAEQGVIDFVDQERFALQLLDEPAVRARLEEQIDLVLVDEFQDTSPLQLAIFLKLAEIVPRSIWVGDQKQAIFGFRGTDPALMDVAIEQILGGAEPETLTHSWRSRPALVDLTSNLFAPSFAARDIPEERVRLDAALTEEPEGLGPVVECWQLGAKNQGQDAGALAAALQQMLGEEIKVRDRVTGTARSVRPGDVAVLCRLNDTCATVANKLAHLGIAAQLPREGLLATLEGRLIVSGLRLWADAGDTLAAAELARLVVYPEQPDEWLTAIVARPGREAFADLTTVKQINDARVSHTTLGVLEVFDRLVHLLCVLELCRRWGGAADRVANIEALRSHAHAYVDRCRTSGDGATLSGLVNFLQQLADDSLDHQGLAQTGDAVTVCTWHKAKGLEWPITVLFELKSRSMDRVALGVDVLSDRERIDLADPLADRWIKYWPFPYGQMRTGIPFLDRLPDHAISQHLKARSLKEQLRVLYVGWTRARDRLVLAARRGKLVGGSLALLDVEPGQPTVTEPEDDRVTWGGIEIEIASRDADPSEPVAHVPVPEDHYAEPVIREWAPAWIQPSAVEEAGEVGEPVRIGERIVVAGDVEWNRLGNAVHGFLAADREHYGAELREQIARRQLEGWGVQAAIGAKDVVAASDRFQGWVSEQWPGAKWMREWPIQMIDESGSMIRGQVDLVLRFGDELVVIDHKSYPGTFDQAIERAGQYAGQLAIYERVVGSATGQEVVGCYVHMPVTGVILPLPVKQVVMAE